MQIQYSQENAKEYLKECTVSQADWLNALIYKVIKTQSLTKLRDTLLPKLISRKIQVKNDKQIIS